MSQLQKVESIVLEMDMIFEHFIVFQDKDGKMLARIPVDPKESWDKLKEFHAKWAKVKGLEKDSTEWLESITN